MDEQNERQDIQHDDRYDHVSDRTEQQGSDDGQVYTAAERDLAFDGSASPDGNGYTTPTGGHGYVYGQPQRSGGGKGRRIALISLAAVLVLTLLVGCIMMGVMLERGRSVDDDPVTDTETKTETGTWSGMFIVNNGDETTGSPSSGDGSMDAQPSGDTVVPDILQTSGGTSDITSPEQETGRYTDQTSSGSEQISDGIHTIVNAIPTDAVISKKPATRTDVNGDGKADVVLDGNGNVLTSAAGRELSAATVVHRVADAVVEITTETIVRSEWIGQYVTSGAGSGVIISESGFIITNHHVIEDADNIVVTLTDGSQYEALLVGTDEESDIALLWIDAADRQLTVATMGASFDLVVGENILAIGNPLGSLGGTVTEGIISATARQISIEGTDMTLLQISAPINPGNSGGGLFNMAGELVGIVNAKCSSDDVEGLGFAIPIDTVYEIICELYQYGYVRGRVTTGLTLVDATSVSTAYQYFRSQYTGVYVYTSSLTDELQYGDLILNVDGEEISTSSQFKSLLDGKQVGDTIVLEVYRNNGRKWSRVQVTLTLGEKRPENITRPAA